MQSAKDSWEGRCSAAVRRIRECAKEYSIMQSAKDSWEGRCSAARLPHKKVREELRDTNFSPLTARKIYRFALGR